MTATYYAHLLAGRPRVEAFRRGIEAVVRRQDRVLEVGTGLGTYAFFAARAGAARVVAVDASGVVHLAEALARANGLADRIDFVRGRLPGAELSGGPFDLLVYEDFPTELLDRDSSELLRDVQRRYLAEGARMVPGAARLHLAPVGSDTVRAELFPGDVGDDGLYGLDWTLVRPYLASTPRQMRLPTDSVLGVPAGGDRLPLLPLPRPADLAVRGSWVAPEAGRVDALALWFDLEVAPGSWISNGPGPDAGPWGQWVLPLDPHLEVGAGATVEASVRREEAPDGAVGWAAWEASVGGERRSGHAFGGLLLGPSDVAGAGGGGPDGNDSPLPRLQGGGRQPAGPTLEEGP